MTSSWTRVGPKSMTGVLLRREEKTHGDTGKKDGEDRGRDWMLPRAREEARKGSPLWG